jgi:hypothetical protein
MLMALLVMRALLFMRPMLIAMVVFSVDFWEGC